MSESRAAAFFDLDKTLMAGSSGMEFAKVARDHGFITRSQMARWAWDHTLYRLHGASDEETAQLIEVAKETLSSMTAVDLERMWPSTLAGILGKISPQMLAEIHRHQDAGRPTYIVSAAGSEMVVSLARVLSMDGGIGTRWAIGDDGVYTGDMEGPFVYGPGKVKEMEIVADADDLDLSTSWAYSDSLSDLPMLEAVGNAVVVNPDKALAKLAMEREWQVMKFDRLGRNLALGATIGTVMLAAGITVWLQGEE